MVKNGYIVPTADMIPGTFIDGWSFKESYFIDDHKRYYHKLARELYCWLIGSALNAINMEMAETTDFQKLSKHVLDEVVTCFTTTTLPYCRGKT
ncbi:unnamed protein product [Ambrosiozyma monospora]|uniref:Unnamed protein product n=1 Tax=Ambrosiozyma monospora TaxID=43982 RepID=A0A9W6YY57_AMBMO|nr:unnamed protein product [Ambrosiozyma monospora]